MKDNENHIISRLEQAFQRKEAIIAEKEATIAEKEATIAEKDATIHNQQTVIHNQGLAIDNLNLQLITHQHAFWWRITKPMRVLTRGVKRVLKAIPGLKRFYYWLRGWEYGVEEAVDNAPEQTIQDDVPKDSMPDDTHAPQELQKPSNTVENILSNITYHTGFIAHIYSDEGIERFNIVTDSLNKGSLFGGVSTSLVLATVFANKRGVPLRIITRTDVANPNDYYRILELNKIPKPEEVEFYSDSCDYSNRAVISKLEVSPADIFLATSWWSAQAIKKTTLRKRFFYIIQEVEPFFYSHDYNHLLCSQMMDDKQIDFIINSHYLSDYFKVNAPNIYNNGITLEPAFPMYKTPIFKEKTKEEKYKLFFYARPNHPRNLYPFGLNILDKSISAGILDTDKWDIFFAGDDIGNVVFCNGYTAVNKGLMSWENYSEFLLEVDLSLSLMYTPHPSYRPFDVAASGGVVLTNTYGNKTEFPYSDNVIMSDLNEEAFLSNFEKAIALATDLNLRKHNYNNDKILRSWDDNINTVVKKMEEKL